MAVEYSVERAIATITLNSPANRNSLSSALVGQLSELLAQCEADETIRAVVLTHTGSTFCAGADLREATAEGGPGPGGQRLLNVLRMIIDLSKPVLARIDGHVRAGGLGLVGACDLALAGPSSSFAFTEVRIGVAPAIISLTTLPLMNARAAARYLLSGDTFDAACAAEIGLVTHFCADVDAELSKLVQSLRRASPQGLAQTKRLLTRSTRKQMDEHAVELAELSSRMFHSDEAREGISAFLEKRSPNWTL